MKAALAIGGTSALSACIDRYEGVTVPTADSSTLPERQFAWNDYLPTGPHGNVLIPNHQLLLFFDYVGGGTPTATDRKEVEDVFRTFDRAYQYGTGDEPDATSTTGLLYLMTYSPSYFDRFDVSLPDEIDLPRPETVLERLGEDPTVAESYDAMLVLTSDTVPLILEAEQVLRGTFDEANGVPSESSFDGVLEVSDRRTGFIGVGRPADELEIENLPENSPTAMGFRSGFKDNQATEDRVAIQNGVFSDGSTLHVSRIVFNNERSDRGLVEWYDLESEDRIEKMFSPNHTEEDVGEIGERLAGQSHIKEETVEDRQAHAREQGVVGHTQKVAAARDENFEPTLLRRSEGVSTDLEAPAMNFISLQRETERFIEVRKAMNGADIDADVDSGNDGILGFLSVLSRGTYLVPPRSHRSLPTPQADQP